MPRLNRMSWRDRAREAVHAALLEYEAQCLLLGESMDRAAFEKHLRDRYPFGERKYLPYKVWLIEQRLGLQYFDLVASGQRSSRYFPSWSKQRLGQPAGGGGDRVAPGQLPLLG